MRHGLKWFIHLRAQRPRVGDEHPAYTPAGAWLPLPFLQSALKLKLKIIRDFKTPLRTVPFHAEYNGLDTTATEIILKTS